MILFKKIRLKAGNKRLIKRLRKTKRVKKICNLENARSIGILLTINHEHEWPEYKKFVEYLQEQNIKVTVLAYLRNKKMTEYYQRLNLVNYFTDKDLNFVFIPKLPFIEEFIQTKFDILIDLSFDCTFAVTYIIAMSKAGFKAGIMNTCHSYYDFMIDMGNLKNITLFIEQLKHYLTIINNQKELAKV